MFSIEMISTNINMSSLVCIYSVFPRGNGNYISTIDENGITYHIVNLSYEDLEDAKKLGIVDTTMKAQVYGDGINKVAFIVDERFPEICLSPEWWYDHRHKFRVEILRNKYQVPDGVCMCEFEDSNTSAIFIGSISHSIKGYTEYKGFCYECNKPYRMVKRRKL